MLLHRGAIESIVGPELGSKRRIYALPALSGHKTTSYRLGRFPTWATLVIPRTSDTARNLCRLTCANPAISRNPHQGILLLSRPPQAYAAVSGRPSAAWPPFLAPANPAWYACCWYLTRLLHRTASTMPMRRK